MCVFCGTPTADKIMYGKCGFQAKFACTNTLGCIGNGGFCRQSNVVVLASLTQLLVLVELACFACSVQIERCHLHMMCMEHLASASGSSAANKPGLRRVEAVSQKRLLTTAKPYRQLGLQLSSS